VHAHARDVTGYGWWRSNPHPRSPRPVQPSPAPTLTSAEAAQAWLRAERDNREAAHTHALHGHALALAAGLAEILRTDGPLTYAIDLHQTAAETAERHGLPPPTPML